MSTGDPLGPTPIAVDPSMRLDEYWRGRLIQAVDDDPCRHLDLEAPSGPSRLRAAALGSRPRCVIEIGIGLGGSGLWFRDRLRTLNSYGENFEPRVIGIDINAEPGP